MNEEHIIFESRQDAGRYLATKLTEYKNVPTIVLAIPNGGVPVAIEVAKAINADLDLVICRKIPLPLTPEGGFGACADDGTVVLDEEVVKRVGLSRQQIEQEANKVRAEIKRRTLLHKRDWPPISIMGKTVILVDDGLASGITMTAAVESIRHRHPKETIVAVPCSSILAAKKVERVADKVVIYYKGHMPMFRVGDFYQNWYDLTDEDIIRYLRQWRMR
ncbi:MAG: phosphoribosyltransferase family protein [Dehalococcoidales bacterium]|nr:phosphoribosyltransferase family protein [Dehalococcoidales bacterium]